MKEKIKNAIKIGAISSIVYLACYFAKSILSIISPQMVENAGMSLEYIGTLSTANMLFYAGGQLINGIIGDKIKGKYMIGGGLVLAGLCNIIMGLIHAPFVMLVAYSASGFFLSTLYAPLVKIIAENTTPSHAEKCCLAVNFASFFGVPIAGIAAFFFNWMNVFLVWKRKELYNIQSESENRKRVAVSKYYLKTKSLNLHLCQFLQGLYEHRYPFGCRHICHSIWDCQQVLQQLFIHL